MCLGSGVAELPGGIRLRNADITDIIMIRSQAGRSRVSPVADLQSREATSSRMAGIWCWRFLLIHLFFLNVCHVKAAAS